MCAGKAAFGFGLGRTRTLVSMATNSSHVPRRHSNGVYISQLIRFTRVCSHVEDFIAIRL